MSNKEYNYFKDTEWFEPKELEEMRREKQRQRALEDPDGHCESFKKRSEEILSKLRDIEKYILDRAAHVPPSSSYLVQDHTLNMIRALIRALIRELD